jgi:curved DNA-binding protein CbpA
MGQNSTKQYQDYYASMNNPSLSVQGYDPYKVLGIENRQTYTFEQLKSAYRQISLKVHPDRGGNKELFTIVTECFRVLAQEYKNRQGTALPFELRKESQAFASQYAPPEPSASIAQSQRQVNNQGDFNSRFNQAFEDNRLDDENEQGYGHIMTPSSKQREDIDIPKMTSMGEKFNESKFNRVFERKTMPKGKDIVVYEEPEALVLSKKLPFVELGQDKIGDYSTDPTQKAGLQYTDYMRAYTQPRLVDPRAIKERKEYKNVSAFEADREATTERKYTDEELERIERTKLQKEESEQRRVERLVDRDRRIAEHYSKTGHLLSPK